jgi:hypothetical protein
MKSKIIMIIAMLAVMVTMMGIAGAMPEMLVATPSDPDLTPGQSITDSAPAFTTYTMIISDIGTESIANLHTIHSTTTGIVYGTGTTSDLYYRFHYGASSSGWLFTGQAWTWTDTACTGTPCLPNRITKTLTVDVLDAGTALNTEYQFKIYDQYQYVSLIDDAMGTVYGTSIPEFPTVALPVAAVIGLVFLFQNKKKKE